MQTTSPLTDPLNLCNACDAGEATTPGGYCAECDAVLLAVDITLIDPFAGIVDVKTSDGWDG